VRAHLRAQGVEPNPGATAEAIARAEIRLGFQFPEDFVEFYRAIDGSESVGDSLFKLWPLAEVGSVPDVVAPYRGIPDYGQISQTLPGAGDYFAFADCLIWSHVLAVRLRPATCGTPVVWICGSAFAYVAPSFAKFWSLFLEEPDVVLWARGADVLPGAG
jgi:hypothetical protein